MNWRIKPLPNSAPHSRASSAKLLPVVTKPYRQRLLKRWPGSGESRNHEGRGVQIETRRFFTHRIGVFRTMVKALLSLAVVAGLAATAVSADMMGGHTSG